MANELELVLESVERRAKLAMTYVDQDGEETEREIVVSSVYKAKRGMCVNAFCYLRGEQRTFRVDRIVEARLGDVLSEEEYQRVFFGSAVPVDKPKPGQTRRDFVVLFPAGAKAKYAQPVRVNGSKPRYLSTQQWAETPVARVLRQEEWK